MTSWRGCEFRIAVSLSGKSTAGVHAQRAIMWRLGVLLAVGLMGLFNNQSICLRLETQWRSCICSRCSHDDVIKWTHFPRYCPFVRGIHRSSVNSPHKGQCRGTLMFSLICVWINGWVNNREAGDLRRYHAHYDVIVMAVIVSDALCNMGYPS